MINLRSTALSSILAFSNGAYAFDIVLEQLNGNEVTNFGHTGNIGLNVDKKFRTTNPIVLVLKVTTADAGKIRDINEVIYNYSGIAWTDFHMSLIPLSGGLPYFTQRSPGNPWSDGFGNPLPNTTNVSLAHIDIFWNVPTGVEVLTGSVGGTPGRLAIDCTGMQAGDQFALVEYPTFVPEPGTIVAMGAGALALALRRKRR